MAEKPQHLQTAGWREWVALPELGIPAIKAKLDSGARTSCLHAEDMQTFEKDGALFITFTVFPLRHHRNIKFTCTAAVVDQRHVRNSSGLGEMRYVIRTLVHFASESWPIEITLTDRKDMLFRMLLGRSALRRGIAIDPGRSYVHGRSLALCYGRRKKQAKSRGDGK